uniref:RING-type domain-containing protein n=1 Tax=Mycena chlorophos TaxID=658473 RepID=A0ABQ0M9Y9_MYCCL|nr:predicted protein [Mycena chlorophos]
MADPETSSPPRVPLKRTASAASLADVLDSSRKKLKEEGASEDTNASRVVAGDLGGLVATGGVTAELIEQLAQELQCGCCCSLLYRPVLVQPCQHAFCGSCCVLWIKNGGTNCPACRGISTTVTPCRPLQTILDVLLRSAPHLARTERERQQADEIYTGTTMRIPAPRESSPDPDVNASTEYARPCPNCSAGNAYGWVCAQPIVDPNVDPENAWPLEDGAPPGHASCGNCENLLALASPLTSKCDFCQVSFCGITAQGRCMAAAILVQQPHEYQDVGDMIQSANIYESFSNNNVEVEIMLDYLTTQNISPRHIYRDIVTHILLQPRGFLPLIEQELFVDVHSSAGGTDPDPQAPRNKICRQCAAEVFLYGLRDWFLRERSKGFLEEAVLRKKDCVDGAECRRQQEFDHAREFNHMVPFASSQAAQGAAPPVPAIVPPPPAPLADSDDDHDDDDDDNDDEEETDVILNAGAVDRSFESMSDVSIPALAAAQQDEDMPDVVF